MELGQGLQGFAQCAPETMGRITMPSVEERLLRRKTDLEAQLEDINNALTALQSNPEVLKILCLISKVNY